MWRHAAMRATPTTVPMTRPVIIPIVVAVVVPPPPTPTIPSTQLRRRRCHRRRRRRRCGCVTEVSARRKGLKFNFRLLQGVIQ